MNLLRIAARVANRPIGRVAAPMISEIKHSERIQKTWDKLADSNKDELADSSCTTG
jgi:hypothetical protein